jgi:hypothetical protein
MTTKERAYEVWSVYRASGRPDAKFGRYRTLDAAKYAAEVHRRAHSLDDYAVCREGSVRYDESGFLQFTEDLLG